MKILVPTDTHCRLVDADEITIDGVRLFVHAPPDSTWSEGDPGRIFVLTDPDTGARVAFGPTVQDATDSFRARYKQVGPDGYRKRQEDALAYLRERGGRYATIAEHGAAGAVIQLGPAA